MPYTASKPSGAHRRTAGKLCSRYALISWSGPRLPSSALAMRRLFRGAGSIRSRTYSAIFYL
eukprot:1048394-Alexandrium_andersonii.AAC.1